MANFEGLIYYNGAKWQKLLTPGISRITHLTLDKNGEIWVVIQKKQGAPSAKKNLESVFKKVDIVKRDKGYYILRAINL